MGPARSGIIEWRGKPQPRQVDNGPEDISSALMIWAKKQGIASIHIQPGKPRQNAAAERYNRTACHEWLDLYIFDSIQEVQDIVTSWLRTYHHDRPDMGIGRRTPAQKLKRAAEIQRLSPAKMGMIPIREKMRSQVRGDMKHDGHAPRPGSGI